MKTLFFLLLFSISVQTNPESLLGSYELVLENHSKQGVFEGKWINIRYDKAVKEKKDFSELANMPYNYLYFKKNKVHLSYRFEQLSEPAKIHFSDKAKTTFRYLNFDFQYENDTIFMKREDKVMEKFIKFRK